MVTQNINYLKHVKYNLACYKAKVPSATHSMYHVHLEAILQCRAEARLKHGVSKNTVFIPEWSLTECLGASLFFFFFIFLAFCSLRFAF